MFIRKPRYSDPTYIRYFFYFADEAWKLAADHNELAAELGCSKLTEDDVKKIVSEMDGDKKEPYRILHNSTKVICLLHAVKDTLIWQVAYSAGKHVGDPEAGWEARRKWAWEKIKGAYGFSELFVVNVRNVKVCSLRKVAKSLCGVVHKLSSDLPPSPKGEEAIGETGYFCWIGDNAFLLIVREQSEEARSADFQCGTFPRLMMQYHKARHYERLVFESVERVIQVIQVSTLSGKGDGLLSRSHFSRFMEMSLIDIATMVENIEKALDSYRALMRDWAERHLAGKLWDWLGNRIEGWLKDACGEKQRLEQEINRLQNEMAQEPPSDLGEHIKTLSEHIDPRLRDGLQAIYRTLRQANDPIGALEQLYRVSLQLMDLLFNTVNDKAPHGKARPADNLYDCIVRAAKGDEKARIQGLGILPDEMASCLHTIRTYANKAHHDEEKIQLSVEDAEIGLRLFLRVLKWFYCEYDKGPKLPSIYDR